MNKKKIIIISVIVALLVLGSIFWITKSKNNKNSSTQSNSSSDKESSSEKSSQKTQKQSTANATTFNPLPLSDTEFAATLTTATTNGGSVNASMEYDKDSNAWRYTGQSNGIKIEAIYTTDTYYMNTGDSWIKLPLSQGTQAFNPSQYKYDQATIKDFQSKVQNKGSQSCPSGTCQVWEITNYQGNDKITFYIDTSSNRISQLITESSAGKSTIVYTYKDITVTVPTNVTTAPNLQHPLVP